jgi:hypothetical protein
MKNLKVLLTVFSLVLLMPAFAQDEEEDDGLLYEVPKAKEDFDSSEHRVIATINWLEKTPLNKHTKKRQEQNSLLVQWITNSPTVTVEVNSDIAPLSKKNPELLMFFMGGWTRYCLEHDHSTDKLQCNIAGLESAIRIYKKGINMNPDKQMDKLVALQEKGELEKWVKKQLKEK